MLPLPPAGVEQVQGEYRPHPHQVPKKFKPTRVLARVLTMPSKASTGNKRRVYRWRSKNPQKYRAYQKKLMRARRGTKK